MKVSEFMIREVICATPEQTMKEVMQLLVDKRVGGLPICDGDGKLVGVITDGDLIRNIRPIDRQMIDLLFYITILQGTNLESRIAEMMNMPILQIAKRKNIITIHEDDDLEKVVTLLSKNHFKKIPVVDYDNRIVGIVSRGDVLRIVQQKLLSKLD